MGLTWFGASAIFFGLAFVMVLIISSPLVYKTRLWPEDAAIWRGDFLTDSAGEILLYCLDLLLILGFLTLITGIVTHYYFK